jgi:hypothetical protein
LFEHNSILPPKKQTPTEVLQHQQQTYKPRMNVLCEENAQIEITKVCLSLPLQYVG